MSACAHVPAWKCTEMGIQPQIQAVPGEYRDGASECFLLPPLSVQSRVPGAGFCPPGTNLPREGCDNVVLIGTDNLSRFHGLIDFPCSFPAITALISFPGDIKMGQHLFLDFPTQFRVQYKTQECEVAFHCLVLVKYEQGTTSFNHSEFTTYKYTQSSAAGQERLLVSGRLEKTINSPLM